MVVPMSIHPLATILSDPSASWSRRPPASELAIEQLRNNCGFALPSEYVTFLQFSNGGEGTLCIEPWYFQLQRAEEVIAYNRGYQTERFLPGFFAIGSNGGDEMLAILKDRGSPCPVYMVPFIPMNAEDSVEIAFDFELFAMCLGQPVKKA
jgi:hypothetical protein